MSKKTETIEINEETVDFGRRSVLSRLGLAASVACAIPLLMTLSHTAQASGGGDSSGHGGGDSSGHGGGDSSGHDGGDDGGHDGGHDGGDDGGDDGGHDGGRDANDSDRNSDDSGDLVSSARQT